MAEYFRPEPAPPRSPLWLAALVILAVAALGVLGYGVTRGESGAWMVLAALVLIAAAVGIWRATRRPPSP